MVEVYCHVKCILDAVTINPKTSVCLSDCAALIKHFPSFFSYYSYNKLLNNDLCVAMSVHTTILLYVHLINEGQKVYTTGVWRTTESM